MISSKRNLNWLGDIEECFKSATPLIECQVESTLPHFYFQLTRPNVARSRFHRPHLWITNAKLLTPSKSSHNKTINAASIVILLASILELALSTYADHKRQDITKRSYFIKRHNIKSTIDLG